MTGYISVKEASEKWNISERWVQKLCEENRIPGVIRFGRSWALPENAEKPIDGRFKKKTISIPYRFHIEMIYFVATGGEPNWLPYLYWKMSGI